jgi:hypothetical protein
MDAAKDPGREPLPVLLQTAGVVGVSRLGTYPAFTGPVVCTLAYTADAVRVEVVDAARPGRHPRPVLEAPGDIADGLFTKMGCHSRTDGCGERRMMRASAGRSGRCATNPGPHREPRMDTVVG